MCTPALGGKGAGRTLEIIGPPTGAPPPSAGRAVCRDHLEHAGWHRRPMLATDIRDFPLRARRRRHSRHKNFCARRRKNKPRKDKKKKTRCRYCDDVKAGKHWKERNKKGCARLPDCVAALYKPRGKGVRALRSSHIFLRGAPARAASARREGSARRARSARRAHTPFLLDPSCVPVSRARRQVARCQSAA